MCKNPLCENKELCKYSICIFDYREVFTKHLPSGEFPTTASFQIEEEI